MIGFGEFVWHLLLFLGSLLSFMALCVVGATVIGAVIGAVIGVPVWIVMTIVGMF